MSDRPDADDGQTAAEPPEDDGQAAVEQSTADDGRTAVDRAADLADPGVSEWLSLDPDEEVEWVGEPTTLRLVGTLATGVVLVPVLVGILILLASPLSYLSIKHTDYVVTTRSLYVKKGVLSTNIESVDLDRIQNTEFTQSFWGKQLGFGTIEVSTAGSSGADISFDDVEGAGEVRDRIARVQREFDGDRGARDGTGGTGERDGASAGQLDDLVAELRATREALERVEAKLAEKRDATASDERESDPDARETGRTSRGERTGPTDAGAGQPDDRS